MEAQLTATTPRPPPLDRETEDMIKAILGFSNGRRSPALANSGHQPQMGRVSWSPRASLWCGLARNPPEPSPVDLDSGALPATPATTMDDRDTRSLAETLGDVDRPFPAAGAVATQEVVADNGYHSNTTMTHLDASECTLHDSVGPWTQWQ